MRTRVATILAIHNGAATLDSCLQSMTDQTRPSDEVIVIDDASTDSTPQILAKWQSKLPLTMLTNEKNLGLTKSLNRGIAATRADYIARIDADDVWHAEKLKKQLVFLEQHPEVGVVGTWYWNQLVNTVNTARTVNTVKLPVKDQAIKRGMWWRNPFGHSCVVIQRAVLEKVGGYDATLRYAQDRDLWFKLLPHTKFANLPEYLVTRTVARTNHQKQRVQMQTNIQLILNYAKLYNPSPLAYLGLIEPTLIYLFRSIQPRQKSLTNGSESG